MEHPHKLRLTRVLFGVFTIMALCGCQEHASLLDDHNREIGQANLYYTGNYSGTAKFVINDTEFSGPWQVVKIYDEELEKRYRLSGLRSYASYKQGNVFEQLKHGHAYLTSKDDQKLICDFYFRIEPKKLNCSLDGKAIEIVIDHLTFPNSETLSH